MAGSSFEHAAEARAALQAIVADPDLGVAALSSEKVMANLLKDYLPDAPREASILVAAAGYGVASTLRERVSQGLDAGTAVSLTASSFADSTPFVPEACQWAATEIALALGLNPLAPGDWQQQGGAPAHAAPDPQYGAPAGFGSPAAPDPRYGAPAGFGSPAAPGPQYGAPAGFGAQRMPDPQYGAPAAFAAPGMPDPRYGAPAAPDPRFGAPGVPDPRFGSPAGPDQFGSPAAPGPLDVTRAPGNWPPAGPLPSTMPQQGQFTPPGSRKSAKIWAAVGAAVLVAAIVVAVVLLIPKPTHNPKPVAAKPSVSVYQAASGPIGVALLGSRAWVTQAAPDHLVELDAATGKQVSNVTQGLDFPWGIAAGGSYVWIANDRKDPGSVSRINATTGAVTQFAGASSGIANPTSIAIQGSHVWVANLGAQTKTGFTGYGSVIELDASTGSVLKTFPGSKGGITYPVSLAVDGPYVWVVDAGYKGGLGGVTRIDTRNGNPVTMTGGHYGFARPAAIAIGGSHVWVLNDPYRGRLSVTEMNASDGSWVQTLSGPQYDFGSYVSLFGYRPQGIAAAGNRVWVADPAGGPDGHGAVTEIDARTGGLVRVLTGTPYGFSTPNAVAAAGSQVWIANFGPKNSPGSTTVLRSFR